MELKEYSGLDQEGEDFKLQMEDINSRREAVGADLENQEQW